MRTIDQEKFLVGFANDLLNRFHLGFDSDRRLLERSFFDEYVTSKHHTELQRCLIEMTPEKLGIIVSFILPMSSETKEFRVLFQSMPGITSARIGIVGSEGGGRAILVETAMPVVVTAMYDVFVAKWVILDKRAHAWRDTAERSRSPQIIPWPNRAMKKAVESFLGAK